MESILYSCTENETLIILIIVDIAFIVCLFLQETPVLLLAIHIYYSHLLKYGMKQSKDVTTDIIKWTYISTHLYSG